VTEVQEQVPVGDPKENHDSTENSARPHGPEVTTKTHKDKQCGAAACEKRNQGNVHPWEPVTFLTWLENNIRQECQTNEQKGDQTDTNVLQPRKPLQ
jgi:hypothetical protein